MWLDRLKEMKRESGLTTREIAEKSGLPEPTLEKLFAGVTKDPKLATMQTLVHCLGHTLDDLGGQNKIASPSEEAMEVARIYDQLDSASQRIIQCVIGEWKKRASM